MWPYMQEITDLVTFTEEIHNGKIIFCVVHRLKSVQSTIKTSIASLLCLYYEIWTNFTQCPDVFCASKCRLVIYFFGFRKKAAGNTLKNACNLGITRLFSKSNMTLLKQISTSKKLFQCRLQYLQKILWKYAKSALK